MRKKAHTRGVICGMLAAISYGANPLFAVPMLAAGVGINSILFYRYFIAGLVYGAYLVCVKQRSLGLNLREFAALVFLALLFSFSSITLFGSFQYIDVGISCTLLFAYPSLVAIISALFYGEKLSPRAWVAIGIATAGVLLLSKGDPEAPMDAHGIVLALASALLYALYIVGVRHIKAIKRLKSDKLNFYIMSIGLIVYVCNLRFCADLQTLPTPALWGCAILLALIPTIVSLETLTLSIKLIGSTRTAVLGALEPLTAIAIGVLLFGESLTWRVLLGFVLIVAGVLLIIARGKKS